MSNEAQIIQAIQELESALKKQLNRTLASEALLEAWVSRTDPRALAGLGEAYDAALDRLAAGLEPRLQLPQLWAHWSALIAELQKSHAALAPQPPRSDDSL